MQNPPSPDQPPNEKVIYFHGFNRQELFQLLDIIKKNVPDPREIAFCTSTRNNLQLRVWELIREVRKDHNYMVLGKGPKPEDD